MVRQPDLEPHDPKKSELISEIAGVISVAADHDSAEPPQLPTRKEQVTSFLYSLVLRSFSLAISLVLAVCFALAHKSSFDQPLPKGQSITSPAVAVVIAIIFAVLFIIPFFRLVYSDRNFTPKLIASNIPWMVSKPLISYSWWTFVFFLFPGWGESWPAMLAAGFIIVGTYDVQFRDRSKDRFPWSKGPTQSNDLA